MQADEPIERRTAPRRVWFVVDRRIVVDEAFDRAQAIAAKLASAKDGPLRDIADRLPRRRAAEPAHGANVRGARGKQPGRARRGTLLRSLPPDPSRRRALRRQRLGRGAAAFTFRLRGHVGDASHVSADEVFPGAEREKALDHEVLRPRLEAKKETELVELKTKPSSRTSSTRFSSSSPR